MSLSDELFAQTTQQHTTTMATTTTSTTAEISTTMPDPMSHNNGPSSEYDLSGKKRFTGSHVFSHMSAFVGFCSHELHCHITNMHDRCSKNVAKAYSLFSCQTFFSHPWNKMGDFFFFLIRAFTPEFQTRPLINLKAFLRLKKTHKHSWKKSFTIVQTSRNWL